MAKNSYGIAKKFFPQERKKNKLSTASFVREVVVVGLFEPLAGNGAIQLQRQNTNAKISEQQEPETLVGAAFVVGSQGSSRRRQDTLACAIG